MLTILGFVECHAIMQCFTQMARQPPSSPLIRMPPIQSCPFGLYFAGLSTDKFEQSASPLSWQCEGVRGGMSVQWQKRSGIIGTETAHFACVTFYNKCHYLDVAHLWPSAFLREFLDWVWYAIGNSPLSDAWVRNSSFHIRIAAFFLSCYVHFTAQSSNLSCQFAV